MTIFFQKRLKVEQRCISYVLSVSIWWEVWLTPQWEFMVKNSSCVRSHLRYIHSAARFFAFFAFQSLQPSYEIHCKGVSSKCQVIKTSGNLRGTEEKPSFEGSQIVLLVFTVLRYHYPSHFTKCLQTNVKVL